MNSVREQVAGTAYVRRALGDDRDDDRGELTAALSAAALEARWIKAQTRTRWRRIRT